MNLRHSWFGIDYFNILEGPSNGFEMINFSEESLRVESSSGERRCCCMDFYHGLFEKNQLRLMLRNRVVELIFHSPYSSEFNSCEFCFRSMKAYLRQHEQFCGNSRFANKQASDALWICHLRINFCTASRILPNVELLCRKFIL